MVRCLLAIATVLGLAGAASADPRAAGLHGGVLAGGGATTADDVRGPSAILGAHLGWLASGARFGFEAQLFGSQARLASRWRTDGVIIAALRLWPTRRVSLTAGVGFAAGDNGGAEGELVADGAAVAATLGVELARWGHTGLSLRALVFGAQPAGVTAYTAALGLALDFDSLSTPKR